MILKLVVFFLLISPGKGFFSSENNVRRSLKLRPFENTTHRFFKECTEASLCATLSGSLYEDIIASKEPQLVKSNPSKVNYPETEIMKEQANRRITDPPADNVKKNSQVSIISSGKEYIGFVEEDDSLCTILFHAKWCRICHSAQRKYKKLVSQYNHPCVNNKLIDDKREKRVRFASVEYTENIELCKDILGLEKFPYILMYEKGEKVAAFSTGPVHNFQKMLESTILEKLEMNEADKISARQRFSHYIEQGKDELEKIKSL